jgi:hypothetical protein
LTSHRMEAARISAIFLVTIALRKSYRRDTTLDPP